MSIQSDFLTGILGLSAYFGMKRIKITSAMIAESSNIEKTVRTRAKAWAGMTRAGKFTPSTLRVGDYDNIIAALESPYQANPDISGLPLDMQTDVVVKYLDIRGWLEDNRPALKFSQGVVAREIEPSETDKTKFIWSCGMIDNVRRIFDLLDSGALSLPEALAFKDLFPELALFVAQEYLRATIDYMYNEKKPTLSGWQLVGLSALMGVPTTSFDDVLQWQSGFDQGGGPGRPASDKTPNLAQPNLTDLQKLDNPA